MGRQMLAIACVLVILVAPFAVGLSTANPDFQPGITAGTPPAAVTPVAVVNPWITNDRVADVRSLQTMAETFGNAYTPDGVIAPTSIEQTVINEYNNFKRRWYHWGYMPPSNRDVVEQMNVFGWALCGSQAAMNAAVLKAMGLHPRVISIDHGGHTIFEVEYDGQWHCLDTMTTYYVWSRTTPRYIVSMDQVKKDKSLVLNAVAEGRTCPGFLLCGDTPTYFANGSDSWTILKDPGDSPTSWSMNMNLRLGETLNRTWESWPHQHTTKSSTPPYHHEASRDWKDTVNLPYWEPYSLTSAQSSELGISMMPTYRRWANGTFVLAPDFTTAGYQAVLEPASTNLATVNDDGMTPDLHVAATGTPATAIFHIALPYLITDANIDGTFYRKTTSDINRIYVSSNGTTWTTVWTNDETGTTQLSQFNIQSLVTQKFGFWVKVELQAAGATTDAGVSNLVITTIYEHNKGGMAYLDKGLNHITVTFDNPAELQASHNVLHVVYKWKEYDGHDWTIDRLSEQYITGSPATFSIATGGDKVPRTESIVMEVIPPPLPDPENPGAVSDLSYTGMDSTELTLTWTATGDDGNIGQAIAYDLRTSNSPITEDNWSGATPITNVPSPLEAGSARVSNLPT